jgi:hypothetical protein
MPAVYINNDQATRIAPAMPLRRSSLGAVALAMPFPQLLEAIGCAVDVRQRLLADARQSNRGSSPVRKAS